MCRNILQILQLAKNDVCTKGTQLAQKGKCNAIITRQARRWDIAKFLEIFDENTRLGLP